MWWLKQQELIFKPGNRREVSCKKQPDSEKITICVKAGAYTHEFEYDPASRCRQLRYVQSSYFDRKNVCRALDQRVVEAAILVDKLVRCFGVTIVAFFGFPFYEWPE